MEISEGQSVSISLCMYQEVKYDSFLLVDVELNYRKNPTLEPYSDGLKRSEDTVKSKPPKIYKPETFGQFSNYKYCVHSDCKTDSFNSPNLRFARFVLPKQGD